MPLKTVLLSDYIKLHSDNGEVHLGTLNELCETSLPPSWEQTKTFRENDVCSKYFYPQYLEQEEDAKLATVTQDLIYLACSRSKLELKDYWKQIIGLDKEPWMQLVLYASYFLNYGVGNCAHRATTYAFLLRKILPASINMRITISSKKGHCVVSLGKKKSGFFVYDPLLNPTILIEHEDYKKILSALPILPEDQRTIIPNLTITRNDIQKFDDAQLMFKTYMLEALSSVNDELVETLNFFISHSDAAPRKSILAHLEIDPSQKESYVQRAVSHIEGKVSKACCDLYLQSDACTTLIREHFSLMFDRIKRAHTSVDLNDLVKNSKFLYVIFFYDQELKNHIVRFANQEDSVTEITLYLRSRFNFSLETRLPSPKLNLLMQQNSSHTTSFDDYTEKARRAASMQGTLEDTSETSSFTGNNYVCAP